LWYAGQAPISMSDMIPVSTCGPDEFKARAEEHAESLAYSQARILKPPGLFFQQERR